MLVSGLQISDSKNNVSMLLQFCYNLLIYSIADDFDIMRIASFAIDPESSALRAVAAASHLTNQGLQ